MTIRDKFAERFGEDQTRAIESACDSHEDAHLEHDRGSDPFKYVLLIVISFQCVEKESYRDYHGITIPFRDFKKWVKENGELDSYVGGIDWLALVTGAYDEYMPSLKEVTP